MEEKINKLKKERKILRICDVFLASLLSLVVSISVLSSTMFFHTNYGLNYLGCILFSLSLTYISSCGINLMLKPLANKCSDLLVEINELEENNQEKEETKNISNIKLRFEGLSPKSKKRILNYIKENAVVQSELEEIEKVGKIDILELFKEKKEIEQPKNKKYTRKKTK